MAITTLSDTSTSLYISGTKIKKLVLNGVVLFNEPSQGDPEQQFGDTAPTSGSYIPLQNIPVDGMVVKGGLVGAKLETLWKIKDSDLSDGLRVSGGIVATKTNKLFEYSSQSDGMVVTGGLVSVILEEVIL